QKEGERATSFCGHTILGKGMFLIEDTLKDSRFADNPTVTGFPFIRFYAGVTLSDYKTDQAVGVFCVKDNKPRSFSKEEMAILIDLAKRAENYLNNEIETKSRKK
ncbi:MAG: GAF domain-containing protein, partial [Candidatus Liptonbacteria bacterium]|nr:GAF domain-containing protein [Candidatus Liptonbacteria bacterium]